MDSVCVFCGSRDGDHPVYLAAARATGRAIARRARGFEMTVHYHNRSRLHSVQEQNATKPGGRIGRQPSPSVTCIARLPGVR